MSLTPAQLEDRLQEIEQDLADRQNAFASAAERWHRIARDREYRHAVEFMRAAGASVTERKQAAAEQTALIGINEEAEYEALKAAIRVMELRAMVGMALLKSAGRS